MAEIKLMDPWNNLRKELIADEGSRARVYRCSGGKLTVGVGRNLEDIGLSQDEIQFLLSNDLKRCENELDQTYPWWKELTPPLQDVLMNMCFQLGIAKLRGFHKFLEHLQAGRYMDASKEMLASSWARQTKFRAERLAKVVERAVVTQKSAVQ